MLAQEERTHIECDGDCMKILLSNNQRKMHGIPLWRKKDKRKRHYTRIESFETIGAFLDWCYS